MLFKTFIDEGLGQVSYIVGCDESKEVVIIDPRRDIDEYITYIRSNDLIVKYILNTHTHADYIGGHLELEDIFSAINVFHHSVPAEFTFKGAHEGDVLSLGSNIKLTILETPGHTPFCLSFTLSEDNIDKAIFTGDALFVGDMGRPDLLGEDNLMLLAEQSYQTAKRFYSLDEGLMVFSSHISGSFCGKNLQNQYFSTIGIEKQSNATLSLCQKSKEEYVQNITNQGIETPSFFKNMALINIKGPELFKNLEKIAYLGEKAFMEIIGNGQIVDLRHPHSFHMSHIPNSINIYECSNVSLLAGSVLDYNKDIFLVGDIKSNFDDFIIKLRRVGLDRVKAVFKHDVNNLRYIEPQSSNLISKKQLEQSNQLFTVNLFKTLDNSNDSLDVELSNIASLELPKNKQIIINCKQGYKSSLVLSYFNMLGYDNVYHQIS